MVVTRSEDVVLNNLFDHYTGIKPTFLQGNIVNGEKYKKLSKSKMAELLSHI